MTEDEVTKGLMSLLKSFNPNFTKVKKFEFVTKNPMDMSPLEVANYTSEFMAFASSVNDYLSFLGSLVDVGTLYNKKTQEASV